MLTLIKVLIKLVLFESFGYTVFFVVVFFIFTCLKYKSINPSVSGSVGQWVGQSYLNPQWFHSGPWRRQILQVPRPLVGEHCPCCLVLSIPLNRPAAIQKILVGVVTS